MLTLKEPIKLNITDGFTTVSEAFYERITGNYGLMSSNITPKELLFFLSAPTELPEELGGMTTIGIQNNITDKRAITMDVVNNVLNRILLAQTNRFTYQDQVYIDSVLNKLGITDVSLFMKQINKLTDEHTNVRELTSLYREALKLRESSPLPEETAVATKAPSVPSGSEAYVPQPRYYLHSQIYERLETSTIYNIVNSFQQDQSHFFGSFHKNELKIAEQLSISNMLTLSELKEQVVQGGALTLRHTVNHFELGDILPQPQTEGDVLSQAAAAAIVSTVEHVLVQQLRNGAKSQSLWLKLENSLSETVENTISRFQSYHSGKAIYLHNDVDLSLDTTKVYKNEVEVLRELIAIRQELSTFRSGSLSEEAALTLTPLLLQQLHEGDISEMFQEGDSITESHKSLIIRQDGEASERLIVKGEVSKDVDIPILPTYPKSSELPAHTPVPIQHSDKDAEDSTSKIPTIIRDKHRTAISSREVSELTRQFLTRETEHTTMPAPRPLPLPSFELKIPKTAREIDLEYDIRAGSELLREMIYREQEVQQLVPEDAHRTTNAPMPISESLRTIWERTVLSNSVVTNQEVCRDKSVNITNTTSFDQPLVFSPEPAPAPEEFAPAEVTHPLSDAEASPELIAQELTEINRRNRERFEAVQGVRAEKIAERIPVPDAKKTMSDALRALESPEAVISELLNSPIPFEHRDKPQSPEAEAYLAGADPGTRRLFEAIMQYERDPRAAIEEGILQIGNLGELNAVTAAHAPLVQESLLETQKLHRETTKLNEQTDTLLEHYLEAPTKRQVLSNEPSQMKKISLVHKLEQAGISDELLERFEQQRTSQNVIQTVSEDITRHEVHEIAQNDINTQVVAQTTEDITQLVNRTLSKQMNAISDKVYHQMEKRLQTERSRRGRF